MNRRDFFSMLAGLPLLSWLKPERNVVLRAPMPQVRYVAGRGSSIQVDASGNVGIGDGLPEPLHKDPFARIRCDPAWTGRRSAFPLVARAAKR